MQSNGGVQMIHTVMLGVILGLLISAFSRLGHIELMVEANQPTTNGGK